jgi:hypothetical protein
MARTRSRKRRPAGARPAPAPSGDAETAQAGGPTARAARPAEKTTAKVARNARAAHGSNASAKASRRGRSTAAARRSPTAPTYGERPHAPWHPLPLSELLILVGAIAVVLGVRKLDSHDPAISQGGAALLVGLGALAIGAFEVSLREHRSGYRSHTILLALLPVLVFHSLAVLAVSAFTTAPRLLNVGLFALDIALFVFLFRLLRARFLDARHARVLSER